MQKVIKVGNIKIGKGSPLVLIAGPCVIESRESAMEHAKILKEIARNLDVPLIFKSSYDKANRTSLSSFRGLGLEKGLKILKEVKQEFNLPILSDVHCREELKEAAKVLDIIQIPAFLSRQTDLIIAAAKTGRVINIKKAQFMAPWDIEPTIKKIESTGNKNIILTERGTSFGYNNLVSDMRSLAILRASGYPVVYDATHSVQLPSGQGTCSGGQREFVNLLSRAAVAAGCDGLFLEVHKSPDKAPCDGPNMIDFKELKELIKIVKKIHGVVGKCI